LISSLLDPRVVDHGSTLIHVGAYLVRFPLSLLKEQIKRQGKFYKNDAYQFRARKGKLKAK